VITDVPGVRLGHAGDPEALTGCTVVLLDEPAVGAVDVRGGAPGTRETDLLVPGRLVGRVDAVLLTGGSAFVPAVRRIFARRFGAERIRGGDELGSVASGLALRARDVSLAGG